MSKVVHKIQASDFFIRIAIKHGWTIQAVCLEQFVPTTTEVDDLPKCDKCFMERAIAA